MTVPILPDEKEDRGSGLEPRPVVVGSSMSSSSHHPTQDQVEKAAAWLMRLREPGARPVFDKFDRWLAEHPAHHAAYRRAERMFESLGEPATELAERERRRQGRSRFQGPRPRFAAARWGALAATLVAAMLVGVSQKDLLTDLRADVVTQVGETRRLELPDGSWVTLNTDTAVRYEVADDVRRVRLDRGEAFFDVARDPSKPFFVESGDASVRVLGTHFNVRRAGDDAHISVVEGRVAISSRKTGARVVLNSGQEGEIAYGLAHAGGNPEVDLTVAWRTGQAIYYSKPLSEVAADLNRYRGAPLLVIDKVAGRRTLSGVFNLDDPEQAIRTAAATVDARIARVPGGALIVY